METSEPLTQTPEGRGRRRRQRDRVYFAGSSGTRGERGIGTAEVGQGNQTREQKNSTWTLWKCMHLFIINYIILFVYLIQLEQIV